MNPAVLDKLGIVKTHNIENELEKCFGKDRADEIISEWDRLSREADASENPGMQEKLYEFLNSDDELSRIVSCYTDADIIREFCSWIRDHREYFGKKILDLGCGTGILSCCLGELLPDSDITSVDRSSSCIRIAKHLKEKAEITNVDFMEADLTDLEGQVFDTVLSVRTFHENIGIRFTSNMFLPFSEQIDIYEGIYSDYLARLASLAADGGKLVCIERNHMDTEFYSILKVLKEEGFTILPESLDELRCDESDFAEKSVFQTLIAEKISTKSSDADDSRSKSRGGSTGQDIFEIWRQKAFSDSEDPDDFTRSQADWYTEMNSDGLIEGYASYDCQGTQLAKACFFKDKNNSDGFLMYQANIREAGVQILPNEALEEARGIFADHKIIDRVMGFQVKELTE